MSHLNITSSLLIFLLYQHITSPLALGVALSLKRVMRIIFDVPMGLLADIIGFKSVFLLGSLLHLLALALLFCPENKICLLMHCLLLGASASCSEGKIEACAYNICDRANNTAAFNKYTAIYYFIINVLRGAAAYVLTIYHANYIVVLALSIIVAAIILLQFVRGIDMGVRNFKKADKLPLQFLWAEIKQLHRSDRMLLHIISLWAICNFLGWQIGGIASISALAQNFAITSVAHVKTYEALFMSAGCIIALFIVRALLSLRSIVILLGMLIACMLIAALFNDRLLFMSLLGYVLFYASLEIALENMMERCTPFYLRATVISVATCATFILSVILMTLHAFMVHHPLFGHRISMGIMFSAFLLYIVLVFWSRLRGRA